jgi:hypothetical protein
MRTLKLKLTHSLLGRATAALAVTAALVLILEGPAQASPTTWNGGLDTSHSTTLTFNYNGSTITQFTIPFIACASGINGEQTEMIFVPSIAVHGGRFSTTYLVERAKEARNQKITIEISGTIGGGRASGTVHGQGACDTDAQPFHADLGASRPVAAPKAKTGACTMAGCLASNGIFINVSDVDTAIKSVDQQQGSILIPPTRPTRMEGLR